MHYRQPALAGEPSRGTQLSSSAFGRSHQGLARSAVPLSLLTIAVLAGCSGPKPAPPAAQAPEVGVVTVHRQSVPVTTELPGRTSAYLVAQVRARVDGIVLARAFTEGGDVAANQRLYQIDP